MSISQQSNKNTSPKTRAKAVRKARFRRRLRAKEREAFYILSALLSLFRLRTVYWDDLRIDERVRVEMDYTDKLKEWLEFNNHYCKQSLKLGLRELDLDELDDEEKEDLK